MTTMNAPTTTTTGLRHGDHSNPTCVEDSGPILSYYDWMHTARVDEEDENGHISNVSYVRWIQEATRAHSELIGWDRAAYEKIGGTWIVKRHEVDYKHGCHAGDVVVVTSMVETLKKASGTRRTRVMRVKDGAEILRARTEWVFVSIQGHRPQRVPKDMLAAFGFVEKAKPDAV